MKPFRSDTIYVSEKCRFYAHILAKAKGGDMTIDQLADAELIDKWEREFPSLVLAYEKNNELRQRNKKDYDANEKEILTAISPLPGTKI